MTDSVTLKIDEEKKAAIASFYDDCKTEIKGEYVVFCAKKMDGVVVTVYESKKGIKVLFSGNHALDEARIWDENAALNEAKEKVKSEWKDIHSQIGSDEVGTGDFFGPVIVVASYASTETIRYLKELGVDDSKKLTDEKILQIVPQVLDKVIYSKLTCTPFKYNEMIKKGYSMNAIKAALHNEALQNVREKAGAAHCRCYVDQFCSVENYYSYLEGRFDALRDNIVFETKGESHYPSVAVSSMIARYSFLQYFSELKEKYGVEFPKGASSKVDEFAFSLKEKVGLEEMTHLVKANFKNFNYLTEVPENR